MIKRMIQRSRAAVLRSEIQLAALGWRMRGGVRLPDFMGIGSPISASTWLAHNLDLHPQVSISKDKETRFFSLHLEHGLKWYSKQFEGSEGRVVGEFTPSYGRLPMDRIRLISRLIPDVRLLMTIRNPIDRAWAGARRTMSMLARHWNCTIDDIPKDEFLTYFELEGEYQADLLGRHGYFVPNLKSGDYSRILDNWLSVFPEEQLLIVFYDEVKSDPLRLLKHVFEHLGVDPEVDSSLFALERINANRNLEMPQWAETRLREMYAPEIARLRERFGSQLPNWE